MPTKQHLCFPPNLYRGFNAKIIASVFPTNTLQGFQCQQNCNCFSPPNLYKGFQCQQNNCFFPPNIYKGFKANKTATVFSHQTFTGFSMPTKLQLFFPTKHLQRFQGQQNCHCFFPSNLYRGDGLFVGWLFNVPATR